MSPGVTPQRAATRASRAMRLPVVLCLFVLIDFARSQYNGPLSPNIYEKDKRATVKQTNPINQAPPGVKYSQPAPPLDNGLVFLDQPPQQAYLQPYSDKYQFIPRGPAGPPQQQLIYQPPAPQVQHASPLIYQQPLLLHPADVQGQQPIIMLLHSPQTVNPQRNYQTGHQQTQNSQSNQAVTPLQLIAQPAQQPQYIQIIPQYLPQQYLPAQQYIQGQQYIQPSQQLIHFVQPQQVTFTQPVVTSSANVQSAKSQQIYRSQQNQQPQQTQQQQQQPQQASQQQQSKG